MERTRKAVETVVVYGKHKYFVVRAQVENRVLFSASIYYNLDGRREQPCLVFMNRHELDDAIQALRELQKVLGKEKQA